MRNKTIQEKFKKALIGILKSISNFWRGKLIKTAPSYWAMIPIKIENKGYENKL